MKFLIACLPVLFLCACGSSDKPTPKTDSTKVAAPVLKDWAAIHFSADNFTMRCFADHDSLYIIHYTPMDTLGRHVIMKKYEQRFATKGMRDSLAWLASQFFLDPVPAPQGLPRYGGISLEVGWESAGTEYSCVYNSQPDYPRSKPYMQQLYPMLAKVGLVPEPPKPTQVSIPQN